MTWISAVWPMLLFFASFVATIVFVGLAASTSPRFLWAAVFTSWLGSFLSAWSIGLLTLVVTFVLLALALGNALGWLTTPLRAGIAVGCGVLLWWVLIHTVDDLWLFFPLNMVFERLCG